MASGWFHRRIFGWCAALLAILATVPADSAAGNVSRYTRHDFATCAARTSSEPGVIGVTACSGLGGIPVVWTGEPDSSWVSFGAEIGTGTETLGSFFEVQPVIEWRGSVLNDGQFVPLAAIVRYWTGSSVGHLSTSRLLVYRIQGQRSCLMGSLKEPQANQGARTLVDRAAAAYRCEARPNRTERTP